MSCTYQKIIAVVGTFVSIILISNWSFAANAQQKTPLPDSRIQVQAERGNEVIRFSTAGFYPLEGSGREVTGMNPAWRFAKGSHPDAWKADYPSDSLWSVVSLPDGMELLPVDASGGINYRGEAWWRKHFFLDKTQQGKRQVLYFEGIMGKSKVWMNGKLVAEHFSGFLPLVVDVTKQVKPGQVNVVAVMADNSDDADFPPGKPQAVLDYCYFGGIYRDVWLVTTHTTHITDPNQVDKVASGGLFVVPQNVSDASAELMLKLNIANTGPSETSGRVEYVLIAPDGKTAARKTQAFGVSATGDVTLTTKLTVKRPALWSPDAPTLYRLNVRVTDAKGRAVDGYMQQVGIRSISFDPKTGFVLNGKPYPRKLIGANRHQDYAVIGNALPNNLHWRDAAKLKSAGMDIIRNAHYPQDPAFMDACDQLGLFVIVNTPGWQFWNDKPVFAERVYNDVRNMVRRERNRPSIIMWEPILNETHYPENFAADVYRIVHEEYPYAGCYAASDNLAKGHEQFDIQFSHPLANGLARDSSRVFFTREWGDNVDDWSSHNSTSRVAIGWGEIPQLIQAQNYAKPPFDFTSYDLLCRMPVSHIGGTLWHSFDHQRGYHPDPFYGGIMDAFRRPKYSYYMFRSQSRQVEPMVFIANELSPFSPQDVTLYSNCDTVILHTFVKDSVRTWIRGRDCDKTGLPYPVITFTGAWDFMTDKMLSRGGRQQEAYMWAEGIKNGQVVATHRRSMARRPAKLQLIIDREATAMIADGSDLVTVVAQVTDADGNIKRLNNQKVRFSIEGEGQLILPADALGLTVPLVWGEAPVLVRSTLTPGEVKVRATVVFEGDHTPSAAEIVFNTVTPVIALNYLESEARLLGNDSKTARVTDTDSVSADRRALLDAQLKEVEAQQEAFGEKPVVK